MNALQWKGKFNKCAETATYHARVYLIYDSTEYAWVVDEKDVGDGVAFGREPTEAAAMRKAEEFIALPAQGAQHG